MITGHERLLSVLTSQIISNVPAAMLLSGYTKEIPELIVGTNLGGLGTLIASMASLISYRQITAADASCRKKYILIFTVFNLVFLLFCIRYAKIKRRSGCTGLFSRHFIPSHYYCT